MIGLDAPLTAADTCYFEQDAPLVFRFMRDPEGYAAFWPDVRIADQRVSRGGLGVDDGYRMRALVGPHGYDLDVHVTALRSRPDVRNMWMDLRGSVDPVVGLPLRSRPLEAEAELYLRPWRQGCLASLIWRVRSAPQRPQQRLLLDLRRLGWRGLSGLKRKLQQP